LFAVTKARIHLPESAEASVYEVPLTPGIVAQRRLSVAWVQRRHVTATVGVGYPTQVPVSTVTASPTVASEEIAGATLRPAGRVTADVVALVDSDDPDAFVPVTFNLSSFPASLAVGE
jgi:hypothetical protein